MRKTVEVLKTVEDLKIVVKGAAQKAALQHWQNIQFDIAVAIPNLLTEPQWCSFVVSLGKVLLVDGGTHDRSRIKGSVSESHLLCSSLPEDPQASGEERSWKHQARSQRISPGLTPHPY